MGMSVSTVIRMTRPTGVGMALEFNNSVQDLDERRHTYMVVTSLHCEYTEQVDTQADELTKSSAFLFIIPGEGSSLYELVSIAGMRIRKDTNNH